MKLKEQELIEQDSIGQFDEIASSIRTEDLSLAFDMVSKNLYSNPIGSFIRELVSNGVDANVDNNINDPVKVHIYQEGEDWYFTVRDFGLGMNPDIFRNVYMKWFNSNKRESNDKIGGWGLGSKSPLSYAEFYEIQTISDGIEYNYIVARQNPVPTATLLSEKPTTEKSGTLVKIQLEEKDLWKIYEETKLQLAYFSNVYVVNEMYYYDNNFTIYDSTDFRVRNNPPFNDEMHIVLGQVTYPINWKTLGIDAVKIPVALKFNIGDLNVTLSREEIDYREDSLKSAIITKVENVKEHLLSLYNEQIQIEDLKEFYNILNNNDKKLKIGDIRIDMSKDSNLLKRIRPKFTPLDLSIGKDSFMELLSILYETREIRNNTIVEDYNHPRHTLFNSNNFIINNKLSSWDIKYIKEASFVKKKILDKNKYKDIASLLRLTIITKKNSKQFRRETTYKEGAIRKVHELIKYFHTYFDNNLKLADEYAPDWWIEEEKIKLAESAQERKGFITFYNSHFRRDSEQLGVLLDKYKIVFYISKKSARSEIAHYELLYDNLPKYYRNISKFIVLNESVIKKIKRHKTFRPIEDIWKLKNLAKHFRRLVLSERYNNLLESFKNIYIYSRYYEGRRYILSKKYNKEYSSIFSYIDKSRGYSVEETLYLDVLKYFKIELNEKKYKFPLIYEEYFDELEKVSTQFLIFDNIDKDIRNEHKKYIISKLKLLKLNISYYE